MQELKFSTPGGLLTLTKADDAAIGPTGELVVIAGPAQYQRILDDELFGAPLEVLPSVRPVDPEQPVYLTLHWTGERDSIQDASLDERQWRLESITQDFDDAQRGHRVEAADDELSLAVLDFLAAAGWTALRDSPQDPISTRHIGANGVLDVEIFTDEERRFLVVIAYLPIDMTVERTPEIGELSVRLSSMMDIGTVDVDLDNRSVRMRSSVDFDGVATSAAMIRNVVNAAVVQGDLFLPAFAAVAGGMAAADALDLVVSLDEPTGS